MFPGIHSHQVTLYMSLHDWATQDIFVIGVQGFCWTLGSWSEASHTLSTISTLLCFEGQMTFCFLTKKVKNIILSGNQSCISHRWHRPINNMTIVLFYSPLMWWRLEIGYGMPSNLKTFTTPVVQLRGLFMIAGPLESLDFIQVW